jgi:hypothetical protein
MLEFLKALHANVQSRILRWFRAREVVKVLRIQHAHELGELPAHMWVQKKQEQAKEIAAVRSGQFSIIDRRSWQYPYIPEALHRLNQPILKNTPYNLRRFSETPIPRRALNLVKNALLSLRWRISIDEDLDEDDPELLKKLKIAEDCLQHPNNQDSYRSLMEAVIEDFLLGGYGAMEPQLTPDYRRPIKLWAVDGSTVRIYADWSESTLDRPHYAQLTGLKGERGIISFLDDELIYIRDNVRSSTPFGLGKMEVCFLTINAFLGAQDMSARAAADQIHKSWLWWTTNLPPGQFETVQRHIQNEAEGQAKISLSTGMPKPEVLEVQAVTPEDLLLDWQTFCIRIIAAGFDLSPMSLGLERDVNRSTAAVMSEQDFNSAIVPAARKFEEAITRYVLHRGLKWKDLKFEFVGLEDPDEVVQAQLLGRLYMTNSITPDEIRERMQIGGSLPGGWGKLTNVMSQTLMQAAVGKGSQSVGMGSESGSTGGMGGGSGLSMGSLGMSVDLDFIREEGRKSSPGLHEPRRNPQIVASLDDSPFTAEDLAQMDPQDLELYRQAGVVPYDSQDLQDQMEQQSPGILQTLSEELLEYFDWLDQQEEEGAEKPAPITAKDQKQQEQLYRAKQKEVTDQEKSARVSEKYRVGYETRNYRGPLPRRTGLPAPKRKKGRSDDRYDGRTR